MGVGYPVDILLCSCLGVDMFDCVYPTRTARFGTAFTSHGDLKLTNSKCKFDFTPIEEGCACEVTPSLPDLQNVHQSLFAYGIDEARNRCTHAVKAQHSLQPQSDETSAKGYSR